jgi:hypothetical protein
MKYNFLVKRLSSWEESGRCGHAPWGGGYWWMTEFASDLPSSKSRGVAIALPAFLEFAERLLAGPRRAEQPPFTLPT